MALPRNALAIALGLALSLPSLALGQSETKPGPDGAPRVDCPTLAGPIRFCGTPPDFVLTPQAENSNITSYFQTPEGIQAVTIIEPEGQEQGLTIAGLEQAALEILAEAAGVPVAQITVIQRGSVIIDGQPYRNLVYRGTIDGVMFVYSNSMVLMSESVAQIVTIDVGANTYSPGHQTVHFRFLEQIQVAR